MPETASLEKPESSAVQQSIGATQSSSKVPVLMGVAPKTLDEAWRMAQFMSQSELVPKGFRGKPSDILVCIQYGLELNLPPMAALSSIAVINGKACLYGEGLLAVLMASSLFGDCDEFYEVDGERRESLTTDDLKKDTTMAVCTFVRRGRPTPVSRRFSIAQAKKAGLWGKAGPWTEYPDRMLTHRARGLSSRDCFPDLLKGLRTAEEQMDYPPDIDVPAMPPASEVKRISETAPKGAPVVAVPEVTEVMLDPSTVASVEQFAGGFTITLGNGMKVDTIELNDASELEKFVGTKNKVRLTVTKSDTTLNLKSFAIAD